VGGYNLTYLKPRLASVGLRSTDDNRAPCSRFWPHGAGRVVAYTGEVDGEFTGAIRGWAGYRAMLEQAVRWTMPARAQAVDVVPRALRSGNDLHVTVDFDPRTRRPRPTPPWCCSRATAAARPWKCRCAGRTRTGWALTSPSRQRHLAPGGAAGRAGAGAPAGHAAYAPEFEPGSSSEGKATLAAVGKVSGGWSASR